MCQKEKKRNCLHLSKPKSFHSIFYVPNVDNMNKALNHYPTTIYKRNWPLKDGYQEMRNRQQRKHETKGMLPLSMCSKAIVSSTFNQLIVVTGLFLSNENTIGPAIDLLALVLREASRDRR